MKSKLQIPPVYAPFCLISTIAYDTPYFQRLGTIRFFRDRFLLARLGTMGAKIVNVYYNFSRKIAPCIYQHKNIKKALAPLVFILIKFTSILFNPKI